MKRALVFALLTVLGTIQAQEPDPKGFQHGGFIRNGINEKCWYTQVYEETNPLLLVASLQHTTHHDLRTITFDDPECMANTLDGLDIYEQINQMMINNVILPWFRGTYWLEDIRFGDPGPPAADQARGVCVRSTNYPTKGVLIEYFHDGDSITGVAYMPGWCD